MNVVGLALTVLGLVGIGSILGWLARVRELTRAQRLLRLCRKEPIDVVITTASLSDHAASGHFADDRLHAQLGYLRATTLVGQAVAETGCAKLMEVHVSDDVTIGSLSRDLILLGGTGGNRVAAEFLDQLRAATDTVVSYDEADPRRNTMAIDDREFVYDWVVQAQAHRAEMDYGLIVLWINPFSSERRRTLYLAGFTPAGTLATARYFVERGKELRRTAAPPSGGLSGRFRRNRFPCFAAIVEIEFLDEDASRAQVLHSRPLRA